MLAAALSLAEGERIVVGAWEPLDGRVLSHARGEGGGGRGDERGLRECRCRLRLGLAPASPRTPTALGSSLGWRFTLAEYFPGV